MYRMYCRMVLIVAFVIIISLILGCSIPVSTSNAKKLDQPVLPAVQQVSMDQAIAAWRNKEAIFVDVRTAEEYKQRHIPGATLIPLAELESRRDEVTKDKLVLLICRSGARSAQANLILQRHGFTNTCSVNGGMLEWRE